MIIDTHAHLNMEPFISQDLGDYIQRAKVNNVLKIVNVGADIESSIISVNLLQKDSSFYSVIGIHPHSAYEVNDSVLKDFYDLARLNNRVVGIGECGLDYYKNDVNVDVQKSAFLAQINLANELSLPLIVHSRDAENDTLNLLDSIKVKVPLVVHCFTGSLDFAKELWSRGFYTSFTGVVTFKNAFDLREIVRLVPDNLFMVETDCPYLAPGIHRGTLNEPSYVVEVVKCVADVKGVSFDTIADISTFNAQKFFNF